MTSGFRVIMFNNREILVNKDGVLKYPKREYEGEISGRRIIRTSEEKEISLCRCGYKKRYLGTVVKDSNGKQKTLLAHRAVAMAFLPNPNNYEQVHHINGNQRDNRVSNLQWVNNHSNSQEYNDRRPKKGYRLHKQTGLYSVRINIYGTSYSLGYYETEKEAQKVYFDTYKEWWGVEPRLEPNLLNPEQ